MRDYVRITKYDGLSELYQRDIPAYRLPGDRLENVLRGLVAMHLTEDEIIESLVSNHKDMPTRRSLLEITKENDRESKRTIYACGENPHVTAVVIKK